MVRILLDRCVELERHLDAQVRIKRQLAAALDERIAENEWLWGELQRTRAARAEAGVIA